jgi:membrane protein DedA with SNARE-associated domain
LTDGTRGANVDGEQNRTGTVMTEIEHLLGDLDPLIRAYGVGAVLVILTLESLGMPQPRESLLIVASVLAARGEISFPSMLFCAWVGGVVGDNIGYLIGRKLGRTVLLRYGEKIGLTAERMDKVETVFARYGPLTVAFARFANVLRQLNGIVAGTLKMDWWRFLLFNALGCALWVLTWGLAGFYLGAHVSSITAFARYLGLAAAVAVAVAAIAVAVRMFRQRRFTS